MMNKTRNHPMVLFTGLLLGLISGCTQASSQPVEPTQPQEPAQMVESGSWYFREQWPHDGNPYESKSFIVFGDSASQEARKAVAEVCEEVLAELIAEFEIVEEEMFRFPEGQNKIHIYAYKNEVPSLSYGMRGYHGGMIAWSLDHETRNTDRDYYAIVLRHELTHIVESLLKGRFVGDVPIGLRVHVWFSEGLGEAIAGGTSGGAIRELDFLNHRTEEYGQINPIAIEGDWQVGDFNKQETVMAYWNYYYPMFQLAVEYMMDVDGLGKSPQDARDLFLDMAEGANFSTAFENRMGLPLRDYEEQFFELMNDYLDEGKSAPYFRMWLAWLILTVGSLIFLIWDLARGAPARWGSILAWVLVIMLFGPLGLLSYLRSYRRQSGQISAWWRALGSSMYSVTGNAAGLILVLVLILPDGESGPLILVSPLLVGWLIFRAPLVAARSGSSYWAAVRRSLLAEFVSTVLVLAAMLAVLILLPERAWFLSLDLQNPLFWGQISLGSAVGALIVYPYNVWMVRRDSAPWPGWAMVERDSV